MGWSAPASLTAPWLQGAAISADADEFLTAELLPAALLRDDDPFAGL
jgi:hypothetical protein